MSVPRLLALLAIWSVVVVVILQLWPGQVQTPGCASQVDPSAACLDLVNAMNDRIWWSQTVPLLVVVATGYLVILGLGWKGRRQPDR